MRCTIGGAHALAKSWRVTLGQKPDTGTGDAAGPGAPRARVGSCAAVRYTRL
jgi:hypothetical protein